MAFAPGLDPSNLNAGERTTGGDQLPEGARPYAQERFTGSYRRVIELPQQADPDKVQARLLISVGKRETSKPRAITVQ